jgi:HAD superfamily hydrolase (TIGR01509 family)
VLKAVIFDVDGVLIDSIPDHRRIINEALAKYDVHLNDLTGDHRAGSMSNLLTVIKDQLGVEIPYEGFLKEVTPHIHEAMSRHRADPELIALLNQLKQSGIRLAVGSSAVRPDVDIKLKSLGIFTDFEVIVSAEDAAKHKPAPDLYLKVLERLGLEPTECVVIEDAVGGVQAARAAGIPVASFGKFNENPHEPQGANLHVSNWSNLSVKKLRALAEMNTSQSEEHGLAALRNSDLEIYSVGISTGGAAEMRMAQANPERHIIATTIDESGLEDTRAAISRANLQSQIEAKLEDVSKPLPYPPSNFDFIYARLVLHYLPRQTLLEALSELHRVLKPGGRLYVVVRSTASTDAKAKSAVVDPATGLTAYRQHNPAGKLVTNRRFFHTEQSIGDFVREAGFRIKYLKSYDETLYMDYNRTAVSKNRDSLIELTAVK